MKTVLILILCSVFLNHSHAQCDEIQNELSSSSATSVELYTDAALVLSPSSANQYYWELTNFSGQVLAQDTVITDLCTLHFATPLPDSMKVCQTVINERSGEVCTICNVLVYRGSIRHWEMISNNYGVFLGRFDPAVPPITITQELAMETLHLQVKGLETYRTTIYDRQGRIALAYTDNNNNISAIKKLPVGLYFLVVEDANTGQKFTKKLIRE